MSIFHLKSYREVILQKIREHSGHKGYKAHLSQRMNIQTSHFSQVMAGKIDLNPDQGAKLCDEWKLTDSESDYFLHLVYLDRATTSTLKKRIKKQLDSLSYFNGFGGTPRDANDEGSDVDRYRFFSSWLYPAVLGAIKIDGAADERDFAKRLDMPLHVIRKTITSLEEMKLIRRENNIWVMNGQGFSHPSREAQSMLHSELRMKAHQLFTEGDTDMLRFGSVTVVDSEKFHRIRSDIQKFVKDYHAETSEPSPNNSEITVFTLDYFRIGRPAIDTSEVEE